MQLRVGGRRCAWKVLRCFATGLNWRDGVEFGGHWRWEAWGIDWARFIALSGDGRYWRGWDGRGVSGHGHQAGARSGAEGFAGGNGIGSSATRKIPARSAGDRGAEPSAYRDDFFGGGSRRRPFFDHGAGRGPVPGAADSRRRDAGGAPGGNWRGAGGRVERGARKRNRTPRFETGQRDADQRRAGEGARLRPGQGIARGEFGRSDADFGGRSHQGGRGDGHAGVYVTGTDRRPRARSPHRYFFAGRDAL